jgi:hypothetical protein
MTTLADTIIAAKNEAGGNAYLWLHDSGDCILWPSEEASENDDGRNAIERWQVDEETAAALESAGVVDGH